MDRNSTLLGQMLQMFPRHEFQSTVSETGTEYHSRGFSSWNHFVAMLFGQIAGIDNLRGIQRPALQCNQNTFITWALNGVFVKKITRTHLVSTIGLKIFVVTHT